MKLEKKFVLDGDKKSNRRLLDIITACELHGIDLADLFYASLVDNVLQGDTSAKAILDTAGKIEMEGLSLELHKDPAGIIGFKLD